MSEKSIERITEYYGEHAVEFRREFKTVWTVSVDGRPVPGNWRELESAKDAANDYVFDLEARR
jgi:hypothetical protein